MAYTTLVNDIQSAVYTNGNNEITGAALQAALLEIVGNLGAGAQYMGEATPSTSTAGIGDKQAFWIAKTQGTYTNMGGVTLDSGFGFIFYNGSTWSILQVPQVPAAGSITATELADGAVTTPKLADAAVTTAKVNDGAITSAKLGANAVTSAKIANGAVGENQLAQECVDTINLKQDAVMTDNIYDGSVTTAKIADGSVTMAKLGAGLAFAYPLEITELNSASITQFNAQVDKYYNVAGSVTALEITLPNRTNIGDGGEVKGCVVYFKTGTLGTGILIDGADPHCDIFMYDGLTFEDNTCYELNCIWNGSAWVVAYGIVANA